MTRNFPFTREMEKPRKRLIVMVVGLMLMLNLAGAIESPQYAVVHAESDFEIRLYRKAAWMCAPTDELSFEKATWLGFHRLFQYIQGANLNYSRIPMTTPVVTSIDKGAGPLHSSAYVVQLYLPTKFQAHPPVGLPELNLFPSAWVSHCVAVRRFSGYATDDNVAEEAEKLAISLSKTPWANATSADSSSAYSIAQYDPPFHFISRTNEVWVDVKASAAKACNFTSTATYLSAAE